MSRATYRPLCCAENYVALHRLWAPFAADGACPRNIFRTAQKLLGNASAAQLVAPPAGWRFGGATRSSPDRLSSVPTSTCCWSTQATRRPRCRANVAPASPAEICCAHCSAIRAGAYVGRPPQQVAGPSLLPVGEPRQHSSPRNIEGNMSRATYCPVDGSPVPPGGSLLPRLLWAPRHLGARAPKVDPAFVPVIRPSVT